jgi:Uma2 family endonuclease
MAAPPTPKTVTYEEWLAMPVRQEGREEVVNGEIRVMPPNKLPHPEVVSLLAIALWQQLDLAAVALFFSEFGLVIRREPLTCRQPDLAMFERATMIKQDGYIHSAPQLAIEVLSPSESRKEIAEKLRDYQDIGVDEVWLVSPEAATVEVLTLEGGELRRSAIVAEGTLTPRRFPKVRIDVAAIWPE